MIRRGYRPKRMARRKLFFLEGHPGIGPKLAAALLVHFGSVERIMTADLQQLQQVPGCGLKEAAIRQVLE